MLCYRSDGGSGIKTFRTDSCQQRGGTVLCTMTYLARGPVEDKLESDWRANKTNRDK